MAHAPARPSKRSPCRLFFDRSLHLTRQDFAVRSHRKARASNTRLEDPWCVQRPTAQRCRGWPSARRSGRLPSRGWRPPQASRSSVVLLFRCGTASPSSLFSGLRMAAGKHPMSKAITLVLVCVLAGSVIANAFVVSGSNPGQRHPAPRPDEVMLGDQEVGILRAAASGAWRTAFRTGSLSATEPTSATEVATVPVVRAPNFARKTTPMPQDQGSLAQQLQRELARVGCYDGQINGAWTTSTRQAMKAFLERVNATLPISQPDGVLLALVQGQRVKTCGTPCPSGQDLTEDGRCVPTAILLREAQKHHAKKAILATSGWSATTVASKLPSAPFEGQMALAGPKADSPADLVKPEPVQSARERSPTARPSGRDWRSELWKRQQAHR